MGSSASPGRIQREQVFNFAQLSKTSKKGLQRKRHLGRSLKAVPGWQYQLELLVCSRGLNPALEIGRGNPVSELLIKCRVKLLMRNSDVWVCPLSREDFLKLTEQ